MFFNDISERLRASRNVEKWKNGKSQLSPVNAADSLAVCMNLILVEREFLTKGTTGRGTRRSGVELSVPRDRRPIDVRANVTKPFFFLFLLSEGSRNRDGALNVAPAPPLAKWDAGAKMPFPSVHPTARLQFLLSVCMRIPKWSSSGEDLWLYVNVRWPFLSTPDSFFRYGLLTGTRRRLTCENAMNCGLALCTTCYLLFKIARCLFYVTRG